MEHKKVMEPEKNMYCVYACKNDQNGGDTNHFKTYWSEIQSKKTMEESNSR